MTASIKFYTFSYTFSDTKLLFNKHFFISYYVPGIVLGVNRWLQYNSQRIMREAYEGKIKAPLLEDVNHKLSFQNKKELAGTNR